MSVDSAACKRAITDWVRAHPGQVAAQFAGIVSEAPAASVSNWKREAKEQVSAVGAFSGPGTVWLRTFACRAYGDGDELRAYVWSDNQSVLRVDVRGE